MLRDSVFDPVLSQFALQEEEIPYPEDEPILDRKTITDAFDEIVVMPTNCS